MRTLFFQIYLAADFCGIAKKQLAGGADLFCLESSYFNAGPWQWSQRFGFYAVYGVGPCAVAAKLVGGSRGCPDICRFSQGGRHIFSSTFWGGAATQ